MRIEHSLIKLNLVSVALCLIPQLLGAQNEYEDFRKSLPQKIPFGEIPILQEKQQKVYLGSELFKFQQNDSTSLNEVWNFYIDIIKKKYAGQEYYDFLLSKFISFAVRGFDLRLKDNPEATRQLIVYTKELVGLRSNYDLPFSYSCFEAIRDAVPRTEFNEMVKIERFKVQYILETLEGTIQEVKSNSKVESNEILQSEIEQLNKIIADFRELDSNFLALTKN